MIIRRVVLPASLLLFATLPSLTHAAAGKAGFAFLKLGVSGRGVAMGDAMSALVSGAAAAYYNPAGLVDPAVAGSTGQILVMHKEWVQDMRSQFLGGSMAIGADNAVAFSLNNTTVADIPIYTRPGEPEGTFTSRSFSAGLSYGHRLTDNLSLGFSARFLYEKILIDESSGFAIDLGGRFVTPVEHLVVGATIANLGSANAFRTERTTLPTTLRIGPGYAFDVPEIPASVAVGSDLVVVFPESAARVHLGGEFSFLNSVAARLGYQVGTGARGFSAGLGISHGILAFDYAFAPLTNDLGNTHTFSLLLNL